MLRVLEVVGLLAPLVGVVALVMYRRRLGVALGWGIAGCLCALAGSAVSLIGPRVALLSAVTGDGGMADLLERLGGWVLARFALLLASVVLLLIASVSGSRRRGLPVEWLLPGLLLVGLGVAMHFVHPDVSPEHQRLGVIIDLLLEAVQFGLLGLGILGLCGAVVARRTADGDTLREPGELLRAGASGAMRLYARSRGGGRW